MKLVVAILLIGFVGLWFNCLTLSVKIERLKARIANLEAAKARTQYGSQHWRIDSVQCQCAYDLLTCQKWQREVGLPCLIHPSEKEERK